jgi:FAD/FMN-containing dehydrogenase
MPGIREASGAEQIIRERAYYLWEQDGRPHGRDLEYWTRAAAEAVASPKAAKPVAAKTKTAAAKTKTVKAAVLPKPAKRAAAAATA